MNSMDAIVPRAWAINWRNSYEQSKNSHGHSAEIYFRKSERGYFYCATAPTASENAERFCEMAALRVALMILF